MKPLAILGGTFDPVHLGHLRAAWEAAEQLDAQVRMVPARQPPHRSPPVASAEVRVALLELALAGQDRLQVDTRELMREGPSYTVDTLRDLRREIGSERSLVLLVGEDAFAGLTTWRSWRDLFGLAHLGILSRPGTCLNWTRELREVVDGRMVEAGRIACSAAGCVTRIAVTPLAISASAIRALLAAGRSPRYLVPDVFIEESDALGSYRAQK